MTSSFTPNKHLELPANGDDVDTWDGPVNADFTAVDTALGGLTTLNVVAASGTIALTSTQYTPPTIILSGLLTANVNYQFPASVGGFWFIYNQTTGNFTVTFSSATGAGSTVVVQRGIPTVITCDGTNVRVGSSPSFSTGTWTPTVTLGTPGTFSVTYAIQLGRYSIIGDMVYVDFQIQFTPTVGTGTGQILFGGLPATASSINTPAGVVSGLGQTFVGWSGSLAVVLATVTQMQLVYNNLSGATDFTSVNMTSGQPHAVSGSLWYKI